MLRLGLRRRLHTLAVSEEVRHALATHQPVVALESTIITHGGMPYPSNLETAMAVEQVVRAAGCTPATIAVMDGRLRVGLDRKDLETLATVGPRAHKTSRRDLAWVASNRSAVGSTTVAATMIIAHMAGIRVFVTGGLGGVHRGGHETMDVSADLTELGRTPVTVVCAGVKSILDIGRTLEYLETQGVTVATLGPTKDFPAFYTPTSGLTSPIHTNNVMEIAAMLNTHRQIGLSSGMVVAVPIPAKDAAPAVEQAIQLALSEATRLGVHGAAVTPFVLQTVNKLTGGEALRANIALIKNNALVGGRIAAAASKLASSTVTKPAAEVAAPATAQREPIIVGGAVRDIISRVPSSQPMILRTSNPGVVSTSWGGVGRNVAEAMRRLGSQPLLISAVGQDAHASDLRRAMDALGMRTDGLVSAPGEQSSSTAVYNALIDHTGEMHVAVADMGVFDSLTPALLHTQAQLAKRLSQASFVLTDANISPAAMSYIGDACSRADVPMVFEPTSVAKCVRILESTATPALITPNRYELRALAVHYLHKNTSTMLDFKILQRLLQPDQDAALSDLDLLDDVARVLCRRFPLMLVKLDADGVLLAHRVNDVLANVQRYSPAEKIAPEDIKTVTGAGDSMVAAFTLALFQHNASMEDAMKVGFRAAHASLRSAAAISNELSDEWMKQLSRRP